jgi:hypothetical protein
LWGLRRAQPTIPSGFVSSADDRRHRFAYLTLFAQSGQALLWAEAPETADFVSAGCRLIPHVPVCSRGSHPWRANPDLPFVPAGGSSMQPSTPLAFVGTLLVALVAVLALLFPFVERLTQLSTE